MHLGYFTTDANASKYNANESVVYAIALLLQDIKEIIYILYIFHFITYIERGEKSPFAPKIGINFKDLAFFPYLCLKNHNNGRRNETIIGKVATTNQ